MPLRIRNAVLTDIEDTETRRLKVLRIDGKEEGVSVSIEVPEVLCGPFTAKENVTVIVDSQEITKGETAKLYLEGTLFRILDETSFTVTATFGGLRGIISIASPKPSQKKVFETDRLFLALF